MHRYKFILMRPLQMIPVLLGVSIISFFLIKSIPGDPVRIMLGSRATAEVIEVVRAQYGLDEPFYVQYFYFLYNFFQGDLGKSIIFKIPVIELVYQRIEPTIFLLIYSLFLSIIIALFLSIAAAKNQGKIIDQIIRIFCIVGVGVPGFWLGIMYMILFCISLDLFPVSGYGDNFMDHIYHLFLPSLTIATALSPVLTRNLRSTLIYEMTADYVDAAKSKGLHDKYIFNKHILKNSLVPTITLLGVNFAWLIGGTVVIETVFSIAGLGSLMVSSIFARDYLVVQCVTIFFAVLIIFTNFIVDILTALIDARINL
ncbi:MAG: ABC transporter permease [Cryomorphaceae bacterium]|nr:ABC transporter permease [Cryomorphaceae bacterium]